MTSNASSAVVDDARRAGSPTRSLTDTLTKWFAVAGPLPPLLVICVIGFAVANPVFFSGRNVTSLAVQSSFLLLIATGQMIVLVAGGLDLSVGATVALSSVVSSMVMRDIYGGFAEYQGLSTVWGLVVSVLVGAAVGLVNGLGVAVLKVNPFIVTLATMTGIGGITLIVSSGQQITGIPPSLVDTVGSGEVVGIPVLMIITVPILVVLHGLLVWTRFGRRLFAVGGNPTAAGIAGVRVSFYLLAAYIVCGVLASFAGWLLTARVTSGQPLLGGQFAMQSITAAIIGGASLVGGRGTVLGTVLGVAFIMVLTNGMNLNRVDSNAQDVVLGIALVVAVVVERLRERARLRAATAAVSMRLTESRAAGAESGPTA